MNWSDLSMSQRSELMSIYLKNGITSLDEMKKHYNSFAEGGNTDIPPERFFGIATPEVTDNTVYQPTYGTLLPEVKVTAKRPYLTDYDLARLRSGQISSETAKSIAQKRATGTSGFMEDLNRLSKPMHEGLSGYKKFMNEHPSLELAYDAASAGLSAFPITAPIGYTMAGIDLLSGIDDMAYNGLSFDNIIDILGVMPAAKYSKTIKGVKGAKKGLRYRKGIPDITINPIGTPIFLGELGSDLTDAINIGEENSNENPYANGGKIFIKPENRGKFTALKKRTGHSASWFKENGTPAQKKMAVFELNSKKWRK